MGSEIHLVHCGACPGGQRITGRRGRNGLEGLDNAMIPQRFTDRQTKWAGAERLHSALPATSDCNPEMSGNVALSHRRWQVCSNPASMMVSTSRCQIVKSCVDQVAAAQRNAWLGSADNVMLHL